jgi:hypothetical protein
MTANKSTNPFVDFLLRKFEKLHPLFHINNFPSILDDGKEFIRAQFHCECPTLNFMTIMNGDSHE